MHADAADLPLLHGPAQGVEGTHPVLQIVAIDNRRRVVGIGCSPHLEHDIGEAECLSVGKDLVNASSRILEFEPAHPQPTVTRERRLVGREVAASGRAGGQENRHQQSGCES